MKYDHAFAMEWLLKISEHTDDDTLKQVPPNTLSHAREWLHIQELVAKRFIFYAISNWYATPAGVAELKIWNSWFRWRFHLRNGMILIGKYWLPILLTMNAVFGLVVSIVSIAMFLLN